MTADIVKQISIGSESGNITGSSVQFRNNTHKTAWVRVLTDNGVTVTVNASENDTDMDWQVDSKTYASGTNVQNDVFSYSSDFPYMNAVTSAVSGTTITSVTFTGRGE